MCMCKGVKLWFVPLQFPNVQCLEGCDQITKSLSGCLGPHKSFYKLSKFLHGNSAKPKEFLFLCYDTVGTG